MEKLWTIISYGAPFIIGTCVSVISWRLWTNETFDFTLFSAILFYSLPAYVLAIMPCYVLLKFVVSTYHLRQVSSFLLFVCLIGGQTAILGGFLRVQVAGYAYLFLVFFLAAFTFYFIFSLQEKKGVKKYRNVV